MKNSAFYRARKAHSLSVQYWLKPVAKAHCLMEFSVTVPILGNFRTIALTCKLVNFNGRAKILVA
jgi:hypothetical protein